MTFWKAKLVSYFLNFKRWYIRKKPQQYISIFYGIEENHAIVFNYMLMFFSLKADQDT